MRVLITGAAGFIGHQLLEELAIQHPEWTLIAADIRPLDSRGLKANIEPVLLDMGRPAQVRACIGGWKPDAIVHLATVIRPPRGMSEAPKLATGDGAGLLDRIEQGVPFDVPATLLGAQDAQRAGQAAQKRAAGGQANAARDLDECNARRCNQGVRPLH